MEEQKVNIIFGDDVKVIDFLADLKDREPLRQLQRFINYGNLDKIGLLFNCAPDKLVVLVLYKTPLLVTKTRGTKLTVFSYPELSVIVHYFKCWLDIVTRVHPEDKERIKALTEISQLLRYQWTNEQARNTPVSFPEG
jgi:hypothetical protein